MKIRAMRVDSFGELKDRRMAFDEPITVVYGKNETGKSSMMEFIRSTLFPDNLKRHYPEYRNSDRGELDVEMSDGDAFTIVRDGKKVAPGRMPSDTVHMEPSLYRSLFAMSPDDLRDSKVISSGDIKSRFLTIPGGEGLPKAISFIDDESVKLMTVSRSSGKTAISKLQKEIDDNDRDINDHAETESQYAHLVSQKEELRRRGEELLSDIGKSTENATISKLRQSQNENVEKLESLKKRQESLAPSSVIGEEDVSRYDGLKAGLKQKTEAREKAQRDEKDLEGGTSGIDPEALADNRRIIEDLYGNIGTYNSYRHTENECLKKASDRSRYTTCAQPKRKDKAPATILGAGAVVLTACIVLGILINPLLILAGVAAMAVCYLFAKKRMDPAPASVQKPLDGEPSEYWMKQANGIASQYKALEDRMMAVTRQLGVGNVSYVADAEMLYHALQNADRMNAASRSRSQAISEERDAASELRSFVSQYGNEERFLRMCREKKEYDSITRDIGILSDSICSSGYPETEEAPVEGSSEDLQKELADVNKAIGDIDRQIKDIFNDSTMEDLLDMRNLLRTDMFETVKRWAVLSLSGTMIDEACDIVYSEVQPGVITTADDLLRTMTCGRYGLEMDLRSNDVKAVSETEGKMEGQWSTGLGDQVYLSIKLAIAKEMSREETLPIMLDDVLQMFDSERKLNACRALVGLSRSMQMIFFTCDAETRDMMKQIGCDVRELDA